MRSKETEKADAGLAFMSGAQHLIEVSGLTYPEAAACLLILICEMIKTAPDYSDDMPRKFLLDALPHAIEVGDLRQEGARQNVQTTGTMQ